MLRRFYVIAASLIAAVMLSACGEGTVDVSAATYSPKIVISGYIFPNQKIERIAVMRNIPINTDVNYDEVILKNAIVNLTDLETNKVYKLDYDAETSAFKYSGSELKIQYGHSYKLDVLAAIDGKTLQANCVTTVPQSGFSVINKNLGEISYREKDESGNVKKVNFNFKPSSNASYYALSIVALENDYSHFIKDNAFFEVDDSTDVIKSLDGYSHQYNWLQNINPAAAQINAEVEWLDLWFYSKYRVIVYAGDKNFRNFATTNQQLQEMDGNFHTPIYDIKGDGIGVFASAIADTVIFTIKK